MGDAASLPLHRHLRLRRRRGHPGGPEGVHRSGLPRDDRDRGRDRAEHRGDPRRAPAARTVITAQLEAVRADIGVDVAKTGALLSAESSTPSRISSSATPTPLVVDPVLVASTGAPLLDAGAIDVLIARLLPLATVVTPNLDEARILAGADGDRRSLAEAIAARGARAVLITGGDGARLGSALRRTRSPRRSRSRGSTAPPRMGPDARTRRRSQRSSPGEHRFPRLPAAPRRSPRRRSRTASRGSAQVRARVGRSGLGREPARADEVDEQADPDHVDQEEQWTDVEAVAEVEPAERRERLDRRDPGCIEAARADRVTAPSAERRGSGPQAPARASRPESRSPRRRPSRPSDPPEAPDDPAGFDVAAWAGVGVGLGSAVAASVPPCATALAATDGR